MENDLQRSDTFLTNPNLSFGGRASLLREVLLKWSPTASTSSGKVEKKKNLYFGAQSQPRDSLRPNTRNCVLNKIPA